MHMSNQLRTCSLCALFATLALSSFCAIGQELWKGAEWGGTPNLPAQAARDKPVRFVRFDLSRLSSHEAARIDFPLPDGSSIPLVRTKESRSQRGGYVWSGKVRGDDNSIATLSILDGKLVGDIVMTGRRMYRIEQVSDDVQIVFELYPNLFPRESEPLSVTKPRKPIVSPIGERCDEKLVEMLVVYTEAACKEAAIGDALDECTDADRDILKSRIQQAETDTNTIFQNSLATPRVSVVHVAQAQGYVEANSLLEDLDRLRVRDLTADDIQQGIEAPLQSVHDLRNQVGADVVTLITRRSNAYPGNQACGKSVLLSTEEPWFEENAFTIVPFDCLTSSFSFTHELGHVMGADHDMHGVRRPTQLEDNYAWVNANPTGSTVPPWMTLMAENNADCAKADKDYGCERLPYFSNPFTKHHGESMGRDRIENNSLVVSLTVDTVSRYRPSLRCNSE